MSIKGHVNYGAGANPKASAPVVVRPSVPARGFVASAQRKQAAPPVIRRRLPKPTDALVMEWLRDLAKRGMRLPTKDQIDGLKGYGANSIIRDLARRGELVIYVIGRNWRYIEIGGLYTAIPPDAGHPYRRISKDGDHYWRGDRWQAARGALSIAESKGQPLEHGGAL